jgi:hypothetical protein
VSVIGLLEQVIAASHHKFDCTPIEVELNARINRFPALQKAKKD